MALTFLLAPDPATEAPTAPVIPAAITVIGLDSDDTIEGTNGDDTLQGGRGNDLLFGNDGNDMLHGDDGPPLGAIAGDDILDGGSGSDTLFGVAGSDLLFGAAEGDLLNAGEGDDRLAGGDGDDTMFGDEGNDTLAGGAGIDRMVGGAGDDIYIIDDAAELALTEEFAGEGNDTLEIIYDNPEPAALTVDLGATTAEIENVAILGNGSFNIVGNELDNELSAVAWPHAFDGGLGNDTLSGGAGNDTLRGGDGDDTLIGGSGSDRLIGDGGSDLFVFTHVRNSGSDQIEDFASGDLFVFDGLAFTELGAPGPLDPVLFANGIEATAPEQHLIYDQVVGNLYYDADANGDGEQVLVANVNNLASLTPADFWIV